MEIRRVNSGVIFKSKTASFILEPSKPIKIEEVELAGLGEYEVRGIAVNALPGEGALNYKIKIDGISCVLISGKLREKDEESFVAVDVLFITPEYNGGEEQQLVLKLEPKLVVFVKNDRQVKSAQDIGQEKVREEKRLFVTREKLPSELEVILLT